jgi:ABC-2 type transport system permease protein
VTTLETKATSEGLASSKAAAGRTGPGHLHVIGAVFKRNLLSYFSNPGGYVFITLFVFVSSCVALWRPIFFTNNQANLDELNRYMPYLLLLFIPAITMNTWADERKQGTDELLLTLPAHDLDVVLGKYLAALGIYSVALLFSLPQVYVLAWVASPPEAWFFGWLGSLDLGMLFATYMGYWLMGVLLIAVGMVASMLSANVTVAFILGALFCAVPIFLGDVAAPLWSSAQRAIEQWSIGSQFADFGTGVISFDGILYFVGLAAAMLYLNMVLLGRRHWAGGEASTNHWLHSLVRIVAVILAITSATVIVNQWGVRADASSEGLHTLTSESIDLARNIPQDRPVLIQAFVSPVVPREYVEVRADLLGLLKEYQAHSGGKIRMNLVPTEVFSEEARQAEKQFGIEPHRVFSLAEGKQMSDEIFLGVAFTSGTEEVVIPFFDRGLPVEYELTRSIRVVSKSGRKKVGILTTDAKLMGGMDMRTFSQTPEWSIVTELKKQYDVSSVSPDTPIASDLDVLLVAQPSSLAQRQIDAVTEYVKKGGATLLFLDPFPYDNPAIAPEVPKQPPGGMFGGGQPPEPKGDLRGLLDACGIDWPTNEIVWNMYNPHPKMADLQATPEIVFIGTGSGATDAFNEEQSASAGLQEIVTLFPGLLRSRAVGSGLEFTPLLRTGPTGGTVAWSDFAQQGFMGFSGVNPRRRHMRSDLSYTLAARVTGQVASEAAKDTKKDDEKKDAAKKKDEKAAPVKINVIAVADLDFIGEQFFQLRARKIEDLEFDNVSFVLNCVDVLAGDESFVRLRRKRPVHRRLERLEARAKQFDKVLADKTKQAEQMATDELEQAQKAFEKQVDAVQAHTEWDERTKEIQLANIQRVAQRRLDVAKQGIEDKKLNEIREGKTDSEQRIRGIRNGVRFAAAVFPPLPPLVLGLFVWIWRRTRENVGASPKRLVYDTRPVATGSSAKS